MNVRFSQGIILSCVLGALLYISGSIRIVAAETTVSASATVTNQVDNETDVPLVTVNFTITPPEGARITVMYQGAVREFDAMGETEEGDYGVFECGTYTATILPKAGYTLAGKPANFSFKVVAVNCGGSSVVNTPPPPPVLPPPMPPPPALPPPPPPPLPALLPPPPATTTQNNFGDSPEISPSNLLLNTIFATDTPEGCTTAGQCADACEMATGTRCGEFVLTPVVTAPLSTLPPTITPTSDEIYRVMVTERTSARIFIDTDSDGVTDFDEVNIFGTSPMKADSDGDGTEDGDEILSRSNPTMMSTIASTTINDDPRTTGAATTSALLVATIIPLSTSTDAAGVEHLHTVRLSGNAPANSYVTIYIFSEPIVVTLRTAEDGTWSYTLDKELSDGNHEVYTALTDAGGRVLAKSEPLPFIKVASALTIGAEAFNGPSESRGFFGGNVLLVTLSFFGVLIVLAIIVVGIGSKQRAHETTGGNDSGLSGPWKEGPPSTPPQS